MFNRCAGIQPTLPCVCGSSLSRTPCGGFPHLVRSFFSSLKPPSTTYSFPVEDTKPYRLRTFLRRHHRRSGHHTVMHRDSEIRSRAPLVSDALSALSMCWSTFSVARGHLRIPSPWLDAIQQSVRSALEIFICAFLHAFLTSELHLAGIFPPAPGKILPSAPACVRVPRNSHQPEHQSLAAAALARVHWTQRA